MVRMNLSELTIHRNKKNVIDLLGCSPYIKIEGFISSIDVPEIDEMFCQGPIYLMTAKEANEYMALKSEVRKVKEAEIKEEENNEECD